MKLRVALAQPVPVGLADELRKRMYYVSSRIGGFALLTADGAVTAIDLDYAGDDGTCDEAELQRVTGNVNHMIANDILQQRPVAAKLVWQSRAHTDVFAEAFNALLASGGAFQSGEGQVAIGEPLLGLMAYIDARLRSLALSQPHAREFRYPTLIPTQVLARFKYFSSFPQYMFFVTRLHNDLDVYKDFIRDIDAGGPLERTILGHCCNTDYCLPPTMCYHTYHQLTGTRVPGDRVVTSRGKAFRFESKYEAGLERLWDFTIREIVFLGSQAFVIARRREIMERSFALMDELELSGRCEVANDHFFATPDVAGKIFAQRAMELKYELQIDIAPHKSISAGSFNFHGPFFGRSFEISDASGTAVTTGCVGFGLERLAYAFVCQHGIEPEHWPRAVREALP